MFQITKIQTASEAARLNNEWKKALKNRIALPFEDVNELLDTDWTLDTFKLVATFYNSYRAEGSCSYTGNLDTETELNYFEMVKRILSAFVINHPDSPAFPPAVLLRILSSSENKCFLSCVMSFMPEDFCDTLNQDEVFLLEVLQNILSAAERRYVSLR